MNESIKKKIMAKKHACESFNANKKNYDARALARLETLRYMWYSQINIT